MGDPYRMGRSAAQDDRAEIVASRIVDIFLSPQWHTRRQLLAQIEPLLRDEFHGIGLDAIEALPASTTTTNTSSLELELELEPEHPIFGTAPGGNPANRRMTMNALVVADGFADRGETEDRLIKGTLLRFPNGGWAARDGLPAPASPLLATTLLTVAQHWQGKVPIQTIIKGKGDWPDIARLNEQIPQGEWELDVTGQPRAPWQVQRIVYLVKEETCERFTFASGTAGAHICCNDLRDRVADKRFLTGDETILPVVELSSKPMRTKYGVKARPDFKIVSWRGRDPMPLPPPTAAKILDDEIPF
jgi:hypothetical protein